ncbi:exported hypothetical protein [Mesorhizobium sp. STM 4661]|nr:exported hypothetical protein [Mesorhizobium sp. STM 4661]
MRRAAGSTMCASCQAALIRWRNDARCWCLNRRGAGNVIIGGGHDLDLASASLDSRKPPAYLTATLALANGEC